jgi:cyclopropane fatty-acyl-phospholipid synthase-like methyltransferase
MPDPCLHGVFLPSEEILKMAIRIDPENNETKALFSMAEFKGQRVLEIGCGDGRLTRLYAGRVAHVTAVDPWAEGIAKAKNNLPAELHDWVTFNQAPFLDYAKKKKPSSFDTAILAWSL